MALVAAGAGLALAQTDPASTLALTVSGQDAQPYAIRGALADASSGPGIRFRTPVSADLTAVHLAWRRPGSDCTVTLQEDAGGNPGTVLDVAAVPTDATWVSAPLAGHLDAGAEYHLVVTCTTARGRLAYTLDRADVGATDRSWALEFVRDDGQANERRAPTTPLFLLAFADGSSWGQPYAPWGGRLTVCGPNEITTTIVPAETTDVHGVDLPARTIGRTTAVEYTISANPDGPAILAGVADATDDVPAAELPNPVELQAGVPYTVRLRAPDLVAGCLQVPGLVSGFPIGAAATGVRTQHVGNSVDGGQTWTAQPLAAVSAHVRVQRRRPRTTTTTTTRPPATSTSTTSTSSTTVTSTTTSTTTTLAPATTTTTPPPTTTVTTTVTTTTVPTTTRPPATTTTTSTTTSTLPPPTTTTTTTTTSAPRPVTTTIPAQAFKSIYAGGFLGAYDNHGQTVADWPKKLALIEADATTDNARVKGYQQASGNAGNDAAAYWFYASLTSIDSKCGCRDQTMFEQFASHEDFWLHDSSGRRISTFVSSIGTGRQIATDVGNPAFVDAWANYQLATMQQYGWDGVWTDNIICAWDVGTSWSSVPTNPRTGQPYTMSDYRRDVAAALGRIHDKLQAAGKRILGNHGGSCVQDFFSDQNVQQQLLNMDGTAIENCVFDFWDSGCGCNKPHTERTFIDQLKYLSFANHNGKQTECILQHGGVDTSHRAYGLASYLLTKEGTSLIGELNGASEYWSGPPGGTRGLDTDLGPPAGDFYCLDPSNGFARIPNGASGCPGTGKIYGRDFAHGMVLSNPTTASYTVSLDGTWTCDGQSRSSVSLGSKSGVVCNR